jgi:hypothetical protein
VPRRPERTANRNWTRAPDYRFATKLRRRMRCRARVLTSVRTATRNFDLELAIATLRLHTQLYVETATIPVVYGGNRARLFAPRFRSGNLLVARY